MQAGRLRYVTGTDHPNALRLDTAAQVLDIEWADGTTDILAFRVLRSGCKCAECRQSLRSGQTVNAYQDIAVKEVLPYGSNAVQLVFSDGHARGIFPFPYLRALAGGVSRDSTTQ